MEAGSGEIQAKEFSPAQNGYDRAEVHAYLQVLAGEIERLRNRPRAVDDFDTIGVEVGEMLRSTQESVSRMKAQAEREAASIRRRAEREAEELRAVALTLKQEAEQLLQAVKRRAESQPPAAPPPSALDTDLRVDAFVASASNQASALLDIAKQEAAAITHGIKEMMRNTAQEADSIIRRAEAEAASIRSRAEIAATAAMREAESRAEKSQEEARLRISELMQEVQAHAVKIRQGVEAEAHRRIEEANLRVDQVLEIEQRIYERFRGFEEVVSSARDQLEPPSNARTFESGSYESGPSRIDIDGSPEES